MCDFLDSFNFDRADTIMLRDIVHSVTKFLKKAEAHYARTVLDLSTNSTDTTAEDTVAVEDKDAPTEQPTIVSKINYNEDILDDVLFQRITDELPHFRYIPTGKKKSPEVCLFGNVPYVYNKATVNLRPQPFASSDIISDVLDVVNWKYGTSFNSVLVNRYANKNVSLGWHQDNEVEIDQTQPIMTLSIGAIRRFWVSDSDTKSSRTQLHVEVLKSNSIFVMKPGLQATHHHKLDTGRGSIPEERGPRYSLTFRRIFPPPKGITPSPNGKSVQKENAMEANEDNLPKYDAVVFGSSLTKGLKEDLLSRKGKGRSFKVYSHGGARVRTIIRDVERVRNNKELDVAAVSQVTLICGGNDIENAYTDSDFYEILSSFDDLISEVSSTFPNASVNVCSLIPRRTAYTEHKDRMLWLNNELLEYCNKRNIRFIYIFSHFLDHRHCDLSYKLFGKDELHLNSVGSSVLGKVLIAVVNKPWS